MALADELQNWMLGRGGATYYDIDLEWVKRLGHTQHRIDVCIQSIVDAGVLRYDGRRFIPLSTMPVVRRKREYAG